jgi:putative endonuclease
MASRRRGTLYVGVTSDLPWRAWEHREGALAGFTKRYGVKTLVWFELHNTMEAAICARNRSRNGGVFGRSS